MFEVKIYLLKGSQVDVFSANDHTVFRGRLLRSLSGKYHLLSNCNIDLIHCFS